MTLCAYCGKPSPQSRSAINRALRVGAPVYCNRACAGLARRSDTRTLEQKRADKAAYDSAYRAANKERLRAEKAAYYARTGPLNREKARDIRQRNMPRHVAYCRQPTYRKKKRAYDEQRRSRLYGEFAECHRLLVELCHEIVSRVPSYYERHAETLKAQAARYKERRRANAY